MNVKSKIPQTVKLKTYLLSILLVSVIFASVLTYTIGQPYIGDVGEVWIQPPFNEATYVVGKYNNTFYYARSSRTGQYEWLSINDDTVLQNAVDATNVDGGGSVYVKAGTYSLSVTVKDNVQLILEKGATGITISIDAGATCWVQDYNAGRTRFYSSGTLMWDENHATGTISTLVWNDSWNQTVLWVVENYTSLLWRGDWNTTVQNIVDLYDLAWKNGWNVTVQDVIDNFDSLSWKGLWNTTIEAIIDVYDIGWNNNWNSTVQDIIDNYDINWNTNWNSTVEDIIANYVWQNSLDMNQHQIVNMTFWSGTSFPSGPAEGQPYWRTDLDIFYIYNGTAWESMAEGTQGPTGTLEGEQPYSYLVFTNATATYMQNGTTGAIDAYSTNDGQIINWALGNGTGIVFVKAGEHSITATITLGTKDWLVGEGSATVLAKKSGVDPLILMDGIWSGIEKIQLDGEDRAGDGIKLTSNCNGYGVVVRDCKIYRNQKGVVIEAWGVLVDHCQIIYNKDDGAYINIASGYFAEFKDCLFKGNEGHAIHQYSVDPTYEKNSPIVIQTCMIEFSGTVAIPKWGVYVRRGNIWLLDSETENNKAGGVWLGYDASYKAWNCKILGGNYGEAEAIKVDYAERTVISDTNVYTLNITSHAVDTIVTNVFRVTGTISIINNGQNTLFSGYKFENSGTSEASNDDWIAHGLAGEPDLVTLTIEETDANYCLQLKATNSTHFQIYLYDLTAAAAETVDKTINWYMEYKP